VSPKFQVIGDQLAGCGLLFDVASLVATEQMTEQTIEQTIEASERGKRLAEVVEVVYRQGRGSVLPSWDDRFDLHYAVEVLRALAVIVGPNPTGDRHHRSADILARLLHDQEEGP
jgi:predicted metal-dependent HD superfamily phosphohydrolase